MPAGDETGAPAKAEPEDPQPSPSTGASGRLSARSDEEEAAWENSGEHSLAATLLFHLGIPTAELEAEKQQRLEVKIDPPYSVGQIMASIAELTRQISHSNVDLKQANALLYALQTLLTASRVQLQEKQAEARKLPRQHLHIHQHQQLPEGKCDDQTAFADTKPQTTPKLITGRTKATGPAGPKAATAPATRRRIAGAPSRSATAKRTPGRKKPPHRAG
jgi:hypothetical protein